MRAPAAAAVAAGPVVVDFLGYHFQAGPLFVGLAGVVVSRQVLALQASRRRRWSLELSIMALCGFVTALLVQDVHSLLYAGTTGIGIGSLGSGVIDFAKGPVGDRFRAALAVLFNLPTAAAPKAPPVRPEPRDDDASAIEALTEQLHDIPSDSDRQS